MEADWLIIAERHHESMRKIANKLTVDHLSALLHLNVEYAELAVSNTFGPEGFKTAILAFGAQPLLSVGEYCQHS